RIDDIALALDDLRHEREVRETISLEIEDLVERRAWEPVLVDGHVVAGEGIVAATARLHGAIELAGRALRGAVEHHVLEEMREPSDARRLVAAADVHPVVENDVRDVEIGPNDDGQPVIERERLDPVRAGNGNAIG